MKRYLRIKLIGLLALVVVFGCGGGGGPAGIVGNDTDIEVGDGTNSNEVSGEGLEEGVGEGIVDTEGITEGVGHDEVVGEGVNEGVNEGVGHDGEIGEGIGDIDVDTTPLNCPGEAGCACEKNDECNSGACIATRDGYVCAKACDTDDDCKGKGYKCLQVGSDQDAKKVCVDVFARLCEPCMKNEDCNVDGIDRNVGCVDFGGAGMFCSVTCEKDEDCPENYACTQTLDGSFCMPRYNKCECSKLGIEDKAKTVCMNTNSYGTCKGSRECTEDGLSECNAPVPKAEDCNGIDDNCDGQTDEGISDEVCENSNEFGTCKGTKTCSGGKWVCDAPQPKPERCDAKGVDENCNGKVNEEGAIGCTIYYKDADHDGFGQDGDYKCLCKPDGDYTAKVGGDKNDNDPQDYPGRGEICDGKDDNGNGVVDDPGADGCTVYYYDGDNDGFGDSKKSLCLCKSGQVSGYTAKVGGDCDDNNIDVHPGVQEVCNNGIDDNCDGMTDMDCGASENLPTGFLMDSCGGEVYAGSGDSLGFSVSWYGWSVKGSDGTILTTGMIW